MYRSWGGKYKSRPSLQILKHNSENPEIFNVCGNLTKQIFFLKKNYYYFFFKNKKKPVSIL